MHAQKINNVIQLENLFENELWQNRFTYSANVTNDGQFQSINLDRWSNHTEAIINLCKFPLYANYRYLFRMHLIRSNHFYC